MSVFDGIFTPTAGQTSNPLFSSSSKFRTLKPDTQPAVSPANSEQAAAAKASDKGLVKGSKKRKTSETAHESPIAEQRPAKQKQNKHPPASDDKTDRPHKKRKTELSDDGLDYVSQVRPLTKSQQKISSSLANAASSHETSKPENQMLTHATMEPQASSSKRLSTEEEAARLRRTVFVGNLTAAVKKKTIRQEFGQYGSIESIRRRSVPVKLDAKMSRKAAIITGNVSDARGTSHAYIVFQNEAAALASLASNMHVVDSRHIRVDRAGQSAHGGAGGSVMYERNRTVFIGNLPFDVEDEEVIVFFNDNCSKLGISDPVEAVRLVRDSASQLGKGFGFVQLRDQPAARVALGFDGQLLRKRPIRVTKAVKVPAHLKEKPINSNHNRIGVSKGGESSGSFSAGAKQPKLASKSIAALKQKAVPTESWQGFKTKGVKKTLAAPANKATTVKHRSVDSKRKSTEKRPSVALRKRRSLAGN